MIFHEQHGCFDMRSSPEDKFLSQMGRLAKRFADADIYLVCEGDFILPDTAGTSSRTEKLGRNKHKKTPAGEGERFRVEKP